MLEVMYREPAHDDVEFAVAEGQPRLDVAQLEADIAEPAFRAHLIRDLQRRLGEIDADHFAAYSRKRECDMARTGCDLEHPGFWGGPYRFDQFIEMKRILDHLRVRISRGLTSELFAD